MFHSSTVTSAFRFLLEKLELETQFYLTSTKILLLEGLNITELCSSSTSAYAKWKINSIFLQPRYYCLKGSTSATSITSSLDSAARSNDNIEILYHVGCHFSLLTLSMRVHSSGWSYIISFLWKN